MVIAYLVFFGTTLITLFTAFIEDEAAIVEPGTIPFLLLAALLWPVTLPCIIFKKVQRFRERPQLNRRYDAHSSYEPRP